MIDYLMITNYLQEDFLHGRHFLTDGTKLYRRSDLTDKLGVGQ
ncbi:hypothetical protein EVA_04995 [gut metagenome]|uniref:Uncharacterized protein n=1 Tax=gut metagenome TaxID=749906 RepID=J9D2N5_9ZZZZ